MISKLSNLFQREDEFDVIFIKILKSMERVQKKPKWGIYKKDDITSNDKGEINVKNIQNTCHRTPIA